MTSEKRGSQNSSPNSSEDGPKDNKSDYEFVSRLDEALESQHDDGHDFKQAQGLLGSQGQSDASDNNLAASITWMMVNTLATVGIVRRSRFCMDFDLPTNICEVFTNKTIFSDPSWQFCQLSFASFHFIVTWFTLHVLSRPRFGHFVPRRAPIKHLIPLAVAMCLNVILPNVSLAFSSVTFYQIARILLTPTVALTNYFLYGATLPNRAIIALIPACLGVGMVSYYDSLPAADESIMTTSSIGVIFAFTGIFASSLYTVWIASYHRKLQMNSMQLLHNQAPMASFLLLYGIPFLDIFPDWSNIPINRCLIVVLSGIFAALINISQFFIIAQTGPVSSTVIGHAKTCTIVSLGWMSSSRAIGDRCIVGVAVALGGIIAHVLPSESKLGLG
ncbi:Fc.00g076650.m01.CDS01 [Cosmosporella sp. VM-42]